MSGCGARYTLYIRSAAPEHKGDIFTAYSRVWGTASPSVGSSSSMLASGRLLQMLLRAVRLLPRRLEARLHALPFG